MRFVAFLIAFALVASASAQPPSDRMVLDFMEHQNRLHTARDLDSFLGHVPKDGYVAIDASGDHERRHVVTPEVIRANTLAVWKKFDPATWSSGLAVRRILREVEYVEIEVSFTEVVPLQGHELLTYGVLLQTLKEQNGKAMLISQRFVQGRSRWLLPAEPAPASQPPGASDPKRTPTSPPP